MPLATFRKLCLDAVDPGPVGRFWAAALDLTWVPADTTNEGGVYGPAARPVLWINEVARPKSVKNRVHLDIYTAALADLEALGATVALPGGDDRRWTVMADPAGNEFCAFLRAPTPTPRLHGLVVDCTDYAAQARFWVDVLGGQVINEARGFATADAVPGLNATFDFTPVPEPKTGPNRVHWDLDVPAVEPLLARGASVLREPGGDLHWFVLADPEGNEFCAFPSAS